MAASIKWPPANGVMFIRSEEFGELVLAISSKLTTRYTSMDFTNAAARVFVWFDAKLRENPDFINIERFPQPSAFRSYVRSAIWNDARRTERDARVRSSVDVTAMGSLSSPEPGPVAAAVVREQMRTLPLPHLTVVERLVFQDTDVEELARDLAMTVHEVGECLEEALEMMLPVEQ